MDSTIELTPLQTGMVRVCVPASAIQAEILSLSYVIGAADAFICTSVG